MRHSQPTTHDYNEFIKFLSEHFEDFDDDCQSFDHSFSKFRVKEEVDVQSRIRGHKIIGEKDSASRKFYMMVEISGTDQRWVPVLDIIAGQVDRFIPL